MIFNNNIKFLAIFAGSVVFPGFAIAQPETTWRLQTAASTHWVEFAQGSELSKLAASYRAGGYETSAGQRVSFDPWYRPKFTETRLTWMTQLTPEFGVLWGAGTGERAQKYQISPSLKLGFIYQTPVGSGAHLSIRLTSVLGGRMAERPCLASYLEQEEYANVKVNCRLAAAQLQPAETLKYLTHALPPDRNNASIRYTVVF